MNPFVFLAALAYLSGNKKESRPSGFGDWFEKHRAAGEKRLGKKGNIYLGIFAAIFVIFGLPLARLFWSY